MANSLGLTSMVLRGQNRTNKNKLWVHEVCVPISKVLEQAATLLVDFCKRSTPFCLKLWPIVAKWRPTALDDAIFEDSNEAEIGVVVQNNKEEVMAAISEKIPMPSSIVMVEVLVARRAI